MWAVKFDIVMELVGHVIKCSAHYPCTLEEVTDVKDQVIELDGEVTGIEIEGSVTYIDIGAAFEPGTE